jgi:DMSO reductase anchor subunit
VIGWTAIVLGVTTVYCMGQIYLLPAQAAWNTPITSLVDYGSMLLLGVVALATILIMDLRFMEVRKAKDLKEWGNVVRKAVGRLAVLSLLLLIPVMCLDGYDLYELRTGTTLAQTSYALLMELYKPLLIARFVMLPAGVGCLFIPILMIRRTGKTIQELFTPVYLACVLVIVAEALGRFLFYAAHIRTGL